MPIDSSIPEDERDLWETPDWLFDSLHDAFNFDGDAAASHDNAKLPNHITRAENALERDWTQWGNRWFCNPPFSLLREFIFKAKELAQCNPDFLCAMILRGDALETQWFMQGLTDKLIGHKLRYNTAVLSPRVNYIRPNGEKGKGVGWPTMVALIQKLPIEGRLYWWKWRESKEVPPYFGLRARDSNLAERLAEARRKS